MKKYPFKFLDAYDLQDTDIFFGRDEETAALYEMVFQHSILLVYGTSGTGKTSLIQCGLAGKFKSYDWLPLMIRRGDDINASLEKALHDAGSADNLEEDEPSLGQRKQLTGVSKLIRNVYLNKFKPVYLIFDQFEELYILGSGKEQKTFIASIQEILKAEQPVKMIFVIREEYLGHLFEFERAVPQLLRKKLRVEPMTFDKVSDVLKGINKCKNSNVRIKEDELTAITEGIFNRLRSKQKIRTIQLPYLQVFLDKLYLAITKDEKCQKDAEITKDTLEGIGDIGDVLRDFLEEQVRAISAKLSTSNKNVSTETIWKILSPFSTLEGTKEPMHKAELHSRFRNMDQKLTDDCVEEFVNRRVMNFSENTGRYELAHDSLAKCIAEKRSDEEIALLEIRRLISSQVSIKKEARELFTEKQLNFIEPHRGKLNLNEEEDKLIRDSCNTLEIQKSKKKRTLQLTFAAMAAATVVFLVLAIWAYAAMGTAQSEKVRADSAFSKFKQENSKFLEEKAAKERTEFWSLESRAETIVNNGGCPKEILQSMITIALEHSDSILMNSKIFTLKIHCK